MRAVCIDPQESSLWQDLIHRHCSAVFHSPDWLAVLAETYGFEVHARVLLDAAGQPVAGIPFCRVYDVIGNRVVSLPFSDYCDPLVHDYQQWNSLIAPLLAECHSVVVRCLHNCLPLTDARFTLGKRAKWHGLNLQLDVDTLWSNLPDTTKRAIKKARREGVVVCVAEDKDDLRAFFEMHLHVRKYKYHLLAQPYQFFERIWHHFIEKQKGTLLVAVHQGTVIGGVMFLAWKDTLYYKFNASAPEHLSLRPNDLLVWEGIKYGKSKGYTSLDFGLSDWHQEGLIRYKRKFATEEKTISFLQYLPDGTVTLQEQQARSLLSHITPLFVDEAVPDAVTNRAGEMLYRFFA